MEALLTHLKNPAGLAVLQTVLEGAAVVLLVGLLLRRPGGGGEKRAGAEAERAAETLRALAEETGRVAARCEENLRERTEILTGLLARLDERLDEAGRTLRALEAARAAGAPGGRAAAAPPSVASPAPDPTPQDILALARRGMDPRAIAAALGKPLGEVELVVNLGRLAANG